MGRRANSNGTATANEQATLPTTWAALASEPRVDTGKPLNAKIRLRDADDMTVRVCAMPLVTVPTDDSVEALAELLAAAPVVMVPRPFGGQFTDSTTGTAKQVNRAEVKVPYAGARLLGLIPDYVPAIANDE